MRHILISIMLAVCAHAFARDAQHGIGFDSPGVLDLAERASSPGKPLTFGTLDAATAASILAAPQVDVDSPVLKFSADEYGCKTPACARAHEAKLIAATDGTVKRMKQRLLIAAGSGQPLVFVDWNLPETKTADGDEETHWYLGHLPGSGYHRVEVQFGHDAPGNFLVNPQNGKVAFVHNGSDLVAPAPDGLHLVTYGDESPPLVLRVAALDATGPRGELQCAARASDERTKAQFKGWRDAGTFDLVLESAGKAVPMRATRSAGGWSVASSGDAGVLCTGD